MNKKEWAEKFKERHTCETCPETNVPRRIIWHSSDGFEWGYGRSGQASGFALNSTNPDRHSPVKAFCALFCGILLIFS
ncbi:MAG: hypothetical protein Pg6C_17820 [Treponemataceae bacterium]|nr:MAG: hypothetical protein Pg6C_17820 [Treponemataceae bacterium]